MRGSDRQTNAAVTRDDGICPQASKSQAGDAHKGCRRNTNPFNHSNSFLANALFSKRESLLPGILHGRPCQRDALQEKA